MRLGVWAALAATAVFAVPSAQAAGMKPLSPAMSTWTGCYVGGNIGAGWESTKVTDEVEGYPIASLSATGILGGAQAGCDYQIAPQWVIGVQGMWDGTGLSDSVYPDLLDGAELKGNIPWFATLTGRVGYLPSPDWMIYAKGGLAWNSTHTSIVAGGDTVASTTFSQSGWTAGIGAEWKKDPHWSFFGEYDYMDFSPTTVTLPGDNIGSVKQNIQAVLFGVNYHFN